jgi:RND family efflux transporter MFP subunit
LKHFIIGLCIHAFCVSLYSQSLGTGITAPIRHAIITANVDGTLNTIHYGEGRMVRKGEIILELEKEEEELNVALKKVIFEDKADLIAAQNKMDTYEKDFKSTKALFETSKSVSAQELWEKQLQYNLAKMEYQKILMREKQEEIEYEMAKVNLEKHLIRAPYDCIVVQIMKNEAESIDPGKPLLEITDPRKCIFEVYIHASKTQNLKKGQKVLLKLDGGQQITYKPGEISFISPIVDKASTLRTVKVLFDNSDMKIQPGVSAGLYLK